MIHTGDFVNSIEVLDKSIELNPLDPKLMDRKVNYFFIYIGQKDYQNETKLLKKF